MNAILQDSEVTPDDLLGMEDAGLYELVDGRLVERHMGARSSFVNGRCMQLLGTYCTERRLGWPLDSEASYQCFADRPRKVRRCDFSVVLHGRFEDESLPDGHIRIRPDLAVEVISPNDTWYEVETKILEYLGLGVPLVWVVNPVARTVWEYRPDGVIRLFRDGDELACENILPGFRCRVGDLLPPPAADTNP
jgi:Uma2 family endonuclease